MRILQLHTRYRQAGGEDRVVAAEAALLRSAGHEVVQVVNENPTATFAAAAAVARAPWNTSAARVTREAVERHKPDLAHVHNTWYASSPSVLDSLRRSGTPVVVTVHNYRIMCVNGMLLRDGRHCEDCVGRIPWRGVVHRCYHHSAIASSAAAMTSAYGWRRGSSPHPPLYLAPTEFVRQKLLRAGVPSDRVLVKPHFVADVGPRLAPPSKSPTVLYVGRLSDDKGVGDLLQAWKASGGRGLSLVLIGDGPLRSALSGLGDRSVRVLGPLAVPAVQRWMRRSRVLVAPTQWYETFGLVVAEAMSAGLPVIVPPDGALAEVAGDASIGAGTRGGPVVERLVLDLQRSQADTVVDAAGKAGRTRYLANFTESTGSVLLTEAYRHALGYAAAGMHPGPDEG
jgi:glycosyltransferase involved in cell wall biosynthesis